MTVKQLIEEDSGETPCSSVSSLEISSQGEVQSEVISAALQGKAELANFPRVHLAHLPTPLEYCPRLSEALGGVDIYVKRDDCTGLATGGNKARKLGEQDGTIVFFLLSLHNADYSSWFFIIIRKLLFENHYFQCNVT